MLDETRAFNEQVRAVMAQLTPVESVPPEVTRRARYEGGGIFGTPEYLSQARWEDAAGVRVRVLAPESPSGTYLHLHGGGWTLGAADLQDALLWELVERTGLAVASVEYRLAPEHPYPAGLDDCVAAARWLAASDLPGPYGIGGESAGAHLAVLVLLRLRGELEFAAANLAYGPYDLSGTPSRRAYRDSLVLTDESMEWFTANLVPGLDAEQRRAPEISPLFADLAGLPPAHFTVGSLDPLLDDSLFMAARWQAAGNDAELRVYDGGVHGFNAFPLTIAREANDAQASFLADRVQ